MIIAIICVAILLLAALLAFLVLPGRSASAARAPFYGVNHAHRGLHSEGIPENSMAAFGAAVKAGYGIELDVRFSKDRQVIVFHDDGLSRLCGVDGSVDTYTYDELKNMRLLGGPEGIPLFSQVLSLVAGSVPLIVELKRGPHNAELCSAVLEILNDYTGPFCVESFDPRIVGWFRKNASHILRGQLSAPAEELGGGLGGCMLAWGLAGFVGRPQFIAYQAVKRPLFIRIAQRLAMPVVWTLRPGLDIKAFELINDAVIFEGYLPPIKFK